MGFGRKRGRYKRGFLLLVMDCALEESCLVLDDICVTLEE